MINFTLFTLPRFTKAWLNATFSAQPILPTFLASFPSILPLVSHRIAPLFGASLELNPHAILAFLIPTGYRGNSVRVPFNRFAIGGRHDVIGRSAVTSDDAARSPSYASLCALRTPFVLYRPRYHGTHGAYVGNVRRGLQNSFDIGTCRRVRCWLYSSKLSATLNDSQLKLVFYRDARKRADAYAILKNWEECW